jgi:hypothetical protein
MQFWGLNHFFPVYRADFWNKKMQKSANLAIKAAKFREKRIWRSKNSAPARFSHHAEKTGWTDSGRSGTKKNAKIMLQNAISCSIFEQLAKKRGGTRAAFQHFLAFIGRPAARLRGLPRDRISRRRQRGASPALPHAEGRITKHGK